MTLQSSSIFASIHRRNQARFGDMGSVAGHVDAPIASWHLSRSENGRSALECAGRSCEGHALAMSQDRRHVDDAASGGGPVDEFMGACNIGERDSVGDGEVGPTRRPSAMAPAARAF
jgi:hypothetical protein